MVREKIADDLINLAQDIARRRYDHKTAIESLSDQLLPQIDHAPVMAVVQDAVESWAYTWLDHLQGGSVPDSGDVKRQLMSVPLEKWIK